MPTLTISFETQEEVVLFTALLEGIDEFSGTILTDENEDEAVDAPADEVEAEVDTAAEPA